MVSRSGNGVRLIALRNDAVSKRDGRGTCVNRSPVVDSWRLERDRSGSKGSYDRGEAKGYERRPVVLQPSSRLLTSAPQGSQGPISPSPAPGLSLRKGGQRRCEHQAYGANS